MIKPIAVEYNVETGERFEREFTDEEIEKWQETNEKYQQSKVEFQERLTAKQAAQAKLEALGLSVEDLQALGL